MQGPQAQWSVNEGAAKGVCGCSSHHSPKDGDLAGNFPPNPETLTAVQGPNSRQLSTHADRKSQQPRLFKRAACNTQLECVERCTMLREPSKLDELESDRPNSLANGARKMKKACEQPDNHWMVAHRRKAGRRSVFRAFWNRVSEINHKLAQKGPHQTNVPDRPPPKCTGVWVLRAVSSAASQRLPH